MLETELQNFLIKANTEEQKYSLRATKKIKKDASGKEYATYRLFKRDGKESFVEKVINWYYQEEQRENARDAIKAGFQFLHEDQKKDFNTELDKLQRLVPGEELGRILRDRQLIPGALDNFCGTPHRSIGEENADRGDSSSSNQILFHEKLLLANKNVMSNTDRHNVLKNADVSDASTIKADMKNGASDDAAELGTLVLTNPSIERCSVSLAADLHEKHKSGSNKFSLQSMFEFISPFARSNRNGGKPAFSRAAGTVARLIVRAKQQQTSHEPSAVSDKALPDKEPSGDHCPSKVRSVKGIEVRHMTNLDLADLRPSVAVLMRNTEDHFAMTKDCSAWLQKRARRIPGGPRAMLNGTVTIIGSGDNIAYLAPHAESDPNSKNFRKHLAGIASVYKQVIDDAVENGRPIVLTPLFHYDDKTIDQYLGAMLRPVYAHLKANKEVKLEIRTTCRRTAAALEKYQRQYPTSPLTEGGKPVPQFRSRLHEADLASEGMIMMAPEILDLAGRKTRKILSEAGARFGAERNSERVQARKCLSQDALSRCYFFADNSPNVPAHEETRASRQGDSSKPAMASGAAMQEITNEIAASYRAAFVAARENECRFLTLPALEYRFGAMLSEELAAVQLLGTLSKLKAEFPDICITVLSENLYIKANFALLESAE